MNREEFKKFALGYLGDPTWIESIQNDKMPFWIPEYRDGWQASYFCSCRTDREYQESQETFWRWCGENMTKIPLCFMLKSFDGDEWWGFNTEEDMILWMLRWCNER